MLELNSSPINDDILCLYCLYHLSYLISCQFASFCLKCTSSESWNKQVSLPTQNMWLQHIFLRSNIKKKNLNHIFLKLSRYFFSINLISEENESNMRVKMKKTAWKTKTSIRRKATVSCPQMSTAGAKKITLPISAAPAISGQIASVTMEKPYWYARDWV